MITPSAIRAFKGYHFEVPHNLSKNASYYLDRYKNYHFMNLRERRALKSFQEEVYPTWLEKITGAAKFSVEVELEWEKMSKNQADEDQDWSHMYAEAWPKVYFEPIVLAFNDITSDDMGQEALKATVKKVSITNSGQNFSGQAGYSIQGDTLAIDLQPFANQADVGLRHEALRDLLESSL